MTIQVGMLGSDGVLLASDLLWMNTESNQMADIRHTSHASKIEIDNANGVAIACARNMELSTRIAKQLILEMEPSEWEFPCARARRIANSVLAESTENRRDLQCTIAVGKPEPHLFHLHSGIFRGQERTECQQQGRKLIAGDRVNAAAFWAERYYSSWTESTLPIRQLVPLAAHLVLSAGTLAHGAIDGLEIVLVDAKGAHRLSPQSISDLVKRSIDLDKFISDSLLNGAGQQFSYSPNVVG